MQWLASVGTNLLTHCRRSDDRNGEPATSEHLRLVARSPVPPAAARFKKGSDLRYLSGTQAQIDPAGFLAVTFSTDALIESVSPSAEQLTEYTPRELVGQPLTQILADCSIFEVPCMMESARLSGHWEGELIHRSLGGKCFAARAMLTPLAGENESVRGYLLVSMPAVSCETTDYAINPPDLAANLRRISHELNNPLAVMMGFAQLILLNTRCEGQIRADMEKLYAELKCVIQVVDQLHSYAIALQEEPSHGRAPLAKQA